MTKLTRTAARAALVLACLAALSEPSSAYIRGERRSGVPLVRADAERIPYLLNDSTAPGLANAQGGLIITPDSSPAAAVRAAMASWSGIDGSRVRFEEPRLDPLESAQRDGVNMITFADTARNRSAVGDAVAVTFLFSDVSGALTDTDIVFSPTLPFSTTLQPDTFDIEATLAHELGHALGLDHSGVLLATLFATTTRGLNRLASLSPDERAFAVDVYPSPGAEALFASIEGRISSTSGEGVPGAVVVAADLARNVVVAALSETDGSFRIGGLPPGEYQLWAEPLDGPTVREQLGFSRFGAETSFQTTVLGWFETPLRIPLAPSQRAAADLTVSLGAPAVNILGAGAALPGGVIPSRRGAVLERGRTYGLEIHGTGLDHAEIGEESIRFLGSGLEIVPGTLVGDTLRFIGGARFPLLVFQVRVAADAPTGLLSIAVVAPGGISILTGGAEIVAATPRPRFSSAGVTHAASFLAGPLAPGLIVSIFGENLGPEEGVRGGFDPVTGLLVSELAGVSVLFNGVPAPMFFAGSGQINAQAPHELTPGLNAFIQIRRGGALSDPVLVSTAAAAPALFTFPNSPSAVALNEDGSLNGPASRAAPGGFVSLFGSGQGAVLPATATGAPAGGAGALSLIVGEVQVFVDGREAKVVFAGLAPGFVGLFQINIRVPADAPAGAQVSVVVVIDSIPSPPTTIAIR